jgi:anti-sigma factor RsiW
MTDSYGGHVDSRLQAFLDGELSTSEAAAVEDHCSDCPACGAALEESRAVRALMAVDRGDEPLRPTWPGVRDALPRRVPGRPSLAYLFGASALAAAGLFLGLYLGAESVPSPAATASESSWSSFSSTLGTGSPGNLAGIYLTDARSEQ